MRIFSTDYGIRLLELHIEGNVYHLHFYKRSFGIKVIDAFKKEGNEFIPIKFKQKNIIDYSLKALINDIFFKTKRWIRNI